MQLSSGGFHCDFSIAFVTLMTLWVLPVPLSSAEQLQIGIVFSNRSMRSDYFEALNETMDAINRELLNRTKMNLTLELRLLGSSRTPKTVLTSLCEAVVEGTVAVVTDMYDALSGVVSGHTGIPLLAIGGQDGAISNQIATQKTLWFQPTVDYQAYVVRDVMIVNQWTAYVIISCRSRHHFSFARRLKQLTVETDSKRWHVDQELYFENEDFLNETVTRSAIQRLTSKEKVVVLDCGLRHSISLFDTADRSRLNHVWIMGSNAYSTSLALTTKYPSESIVILDSARSLIRELFHDALHLVKEGLIRYIQNGRRSMPKFRSCYDTDNNQTRSNSIDFYSYLRTTTYHGASGFISFDKTGKMSRPTYEVVVLRPPYWKRRRWHTMASWQNQHLVWIAQHQHFRAQNSKRPLKLRVATRIQVPFVNQAEPDAMGRCYASVPCVQVDSTNPNRIKLTLYTAERERGLPLRQRKIPLYCCYGFNIDLLNMLARDMKFEYDLYLTRENHSGIYLSHKKRWTGLTGDLVNKTADIVVAPYVISVDRRKVVDFSAPFLYTRFRMLMARNDLSPSIGAFLEPLDWSMWVGVFITLHITALAATFYEWHSPYGQTPNGRNREKVFSLPSALTLSWSILFSHTVPTKSPKCWSSRFLINVWACFSLVFIASYTANLAAFMVGENSAGKLTGINDYKIRAYGYRCATVGGSDTQFYLKNNYPDIYRQVERLRLVSRWKRKGAKHLIKQLKDNKLDLLVLESITAEYYMKTMHQFHLKAVGDDFGSQMHGIGLQKNSPFTAEVSLLIMQYEREGQLEELQKFWSRRLLGKSSDDKRHSIKLNASTFAGVFLLFGVGIALGTLTLLCETIVYYCCVPKLRHRKSNRWVLPYSQRLFRAVTWKRYRGTFRAMNTINQEVRRPLLGRDYSSQSTSSVERCNRFNLGSIYSELLYTAEVQTRAQTRRFSSPRHSCHTLPLNNAPTLASDRFNKISSMSSITYHNIAVQTDIEEKVQDQLRLVDDSIVRRVDDFDRDLRGMREQLARALRDKERLMTKLARLESKPVGEIELELRAPNKEYNKLVPFDRLGKVEKLTNIDRLKGAKRPQDLPLREDVTVHLPRSSFRETDF